MVRVLSFLLILSTLHIFSQPDLILLNYQADSGFEHDSKAKALNMVEMLAEKNGWKIVTSSDTAALNTKNLSQFDVIVFNNNCGTDARIFSDDQHRALQEYIRSGGGFVGVHCAAAIWHEGGEFQAWYEKLVGARVLDHPHVQKAKLVVENTAHYCTTHLPEEWLIEDELYRFTHNPREHVNVLISLDEDSYEGEEKMGGDHPFTWYQNYDGGRSFYTALGHTLEMYDNKEFIALVEKGILWASGKSKAIE